MSGALSELGGIALNTVGEAVAFAAGYGTRDAIAPPAVAIGQKAWAFAPIRALDPADAARIVAQGLEPLAWGEGEAAQYGYSKGRFDELVDATLTAPAIGELLRMQRRGTISADDFAYGLRKAQREPRWDAAYVDLEGERLDPAVIATAIQRGVMTDPGLLPVGPPSAVGVVDPMPVSTLDPVAEAAAAGVDLERLGVMARIVGLPPAPVQLMQLLNRGVIEQADFDRGVAEGNTRNEWGAVLVQLRRRLLTPHNYAELQLRGYIDQAARDAGAALSGMEPADTELLYNVLGRSIAVKAVTTGLARGGKYPGSYANVPDPYRSTIERSNVREEFAELAYANRYTYPPPFVVRALAQGGEISSDTTKQILLALGWLPTLVDEVVAAWGAAVTTVADKHVTKAQTQLWTRTHTSYVAAEISDADATPALAAAGVLQAAVPEVLQLWSTERGLIRKQLSPAEVVKAVQDKATNPATGQPWTAAEGLAALEARGYSSDDATTLLEL